MQVRPKQKWMASRARMIAARTASRTHHLPNFSGSSSEQSMTYSEDELSAMQRECAFLLRLPCDLLLAVCTRTV